MADQTDADHWDMAMREGGAPPDQPAVALPNGVLAAVFTGDVTKDGRVDVAAKAAELALGMPDGWLGRTDDVG